MIVTGDGDLFEVDRCTFSTAGKSSTPRRPLERSLRRPAAVLASLALLLLMLLFSLFLMLLLLVVVVPVVAEPVEELDSDELCISVFDVDVAVFCVCSFFVVEMSFVSLGSLVFEGVVVDGDERPVEFRAAAAAAAAERRVGVPL